MKVVCPRCGQEGSVYILRQRDRLYVYVRHLKKRCYVGPVKRIDELLQQQIAMSLYEVVKNRRF
ncbi:MAG: hypothetical protein QXT13_12615 [Pyrobaculum sp.]